MMKKTRDLMRVGSAKVAEPPWIAAHSWPLTVEAFRQMSYIERARLKRWAPEWYGIMTEEDKRRDYK